MAESLLSLLSLGQNAGFAAQTYLDTLAELSLDEFRFSEPERLTRTSHSNFHSLQTISQRHQRAVVYSAVNHDALEESLTSISHDITGLSQDLSRLDACGDAISTTFGKVGEKTIVAGRREALKLLHNAERLGDVLNLPSLLVSAVCVGPTSHLSTFDLYAYARRLASLYPQSRLISSILVEANAVIHRMTTDLIMALNAPGLRLAAGLRTIGWLKRILPDLVPSVSSDDALTAVFLICRLRTFLTRLAALEPLRELAEQERIHQAKHVSAWLGGKHTEQYLKRYTEAFREHAFVIVSMSKSVDASYISSESNDNIHFAAPSTLLTFPLHLVGLLLQTLRTYLPNIKDQTSRDSIITQVLYCAGSLGRLGAEFGFLLSTLGRDEWTDLVKRHRQLAGRLESVIGNYRGSRAPGTCVVSPSAGL